MRNAMRVYGSSVLLGLVLSVSFSVNAQDQSLKASNKYKEPTRGFFIEHGTTSGQGNASIDLHSGSSELESGGGVRLGLPNAELIINSGFYSYDENQVLVKYAMQDLHRSGSRETPFQWSLVGGFSHTDLEDDNGRSLIDQTNIKLGAAFTVAADAAVFTFGPRLVSANGKNGSLDDTFVEFDLGAYVGIIDTSAGLFSAGFEALLTTADKVDDTFALGARWAYNERLNLDFVPLVYSNRDLIGVPGMVRVNVNF